MTRTIELTQGMHTLVSNEDYEWLMQWHWHVTKGNTTYYAVRYTRKAEVDLYPYRTRLSIHGVLYEGRITQGLMVDHRNGNGLDNRRSNLRLCTNAQNLRNHTRAPKHSTTGITGVSWHKRDKRWRAYIKVNDKNVHLGYYKTIEEAIAVRRAAELQYFGKWAHQPE
jgi:hypothetical protein